MRAIGLFVLSLAVSSAALAVGQPSPAPGERAAVPPAEAPDEVVVRGRRLAAMRFEIEQARLHAYEIFNEINSDDDFDVSCVSESSTGTRMRQQRCRANFEGRISSRAASEYIAALKWVCPTGMTQGCIFSGYSSAGISAAQGVEGELPGKRQQLDREIVRLANEDDEFAQAILDYYELHQRYEAERRRRREE
jgi:hypothetical protein